MEHQEIKDLYSDFLMGIPGFTKDMGLTGILALLNALNNFHKELRVIHIAGTNGKGSSAIMLSSIYQQANYQVATFTSPYFSDIRECISINNKVISVQFMNEATSKVKEAYNTLVAEEAPLPTHYECITVVALLSMYIACVDICIIETLMGGLNDATNIFDAPLVSLITSISYDHMEYLGDTLASIATHKAGIIKPHCPIILNRNPDEVITICTSKANQLGSPFIYSWDKQNKETAQYFSYLSLLGDHQYENLLGVLSVIELLSDQFIVDQGAISIGLSKVIHPCRIEKQTYKNLPFILDGSHNVDGIKALISYITKNHSTDNITLIFGILRDKDFQTITSLLFPLAKKVILVTPESTRALDATELYNVLPQKLQDKSVIATDMEDALLRAICLSNNEDPHKNKTQAIQSLVIACGSFTVCYPIRYLIM